MVVLNLFGGEGLRLKVLDPVARETEVCICVYIQLRDRKTQKRLRDGFWRTFTFNNIYFQSFQTIRNMHYFSNSKRQ